VCGIFLGCLLYADDIILLSPSVEGLQRMLNKCFEISHFISLQFNVKKCHCIVIGKMYKAAISPMLLNGQAVEWCDRIKCLGVYLANTKSVKFDINPMKRSFYAACNSIFSHSQGTNELVLLSLQESYSLSVLMYASPALNFQHKQIGELNAYECMITVFSPLCTAIVNIQSGFYEYVHS